jgi:prepilin-type N-terminal cleavage/methylation domain-containing protein
MKLCVNQWQVGQGGLTPPLAFSSPLVPDCALKTARPTAAASAGRAFTLIEMLVVLGIIGVLAAMTLPSFKKAGKGNVTESATRQLMDDLGYARLKAISGRVKVYVVFVPDYDWFRNYIPQATLDSAIITNYFFNNNAANNVIGGQLTAYALYSPRSLGDQPGQSTPRYLTDWRSLPDGAFFPAGAFRHSGIFHNVPTATPGASPQMAGAIPVDDAPGASALPLPYIAFDEQGRLFGRLTNITISVVEGSILHPKHTNGMNIVQNTDAVETATALPPAPANSIVPGIEYLVIGTPGLPLIPGAATSGAAQITYGAPARVYTSGQTFVGQAGQTSFPAAGVVNGARVVQHYGVRIDWVTGRAKAVKPELQ